MFKKSVKKVVSTVIAILMLASMITVMAADDVTTVANIDFEGYTDATGIGTPSGVRVFNASADKTPIYPAQDSKYGTVVELNKVADCWSPLAMGIYPSNLDSSKALIMETAVKVESMGAAVAIEMYSPTTRVLAFGNDGNIAVGGVKVGAYETDVWYEVRAEYIASQKYLLVTVDGGAYDNAEFPVTNFSDVIPNEIDFGFRDATSSVAKAYIGYFKAYQTAYDRLVSFSESFDTYSDTTGKGKPNGMEISGITGSETTVMPGTDEIYGGTAVLTKAANKSNSGAIEKKGVTFDSSKSLYIETAIKTNAVSTTTVDVWPNQFVRFDTSGKLYAGHINGTGGTQIGTYEADTWYDIKIQYVPSSKNLILTIDGGMYDSTVVQIENWVALSSGFALDMGYRDWSSHSEDSTVEFGYLKIYQKSAEPFYNDIRSTFDGYKVGAITDNAYTGQKYCNGFENDKNHANVSIAETDTAHGKSMAVVATGEWSPLQYKHSLNAPYATKVLDGTAVIEYSVKFAEYAKTNLICDTAQAGSDGKKYFTTAYITEGSKFGKLTVEEDTWYRIVTVADVDGALSQYMYEEANPANFGVASDKDISSYGGLSTIAIASYGIADTQTDVYIDNIRIYTASDMALLSKSEFAPDYTAMLNQGVVFEFTSPLKYALVEVKADDEIVPAANYKISKAGNYVIVTPASLYDEETDYTVTVTQACDVFDNIIKKVGSVSFATGKLKDISAPVFTKGGNVITSLENGTISADVNFAFGDGAAHTVKMFFALYNKTTGKLEGVDVSTKNITADNILLSLDVKDASDSYVTVFAWDGSLNPYIEEVSLGK